MSNKDTIFYRGNSSVSIDFSASQISTDKSLKLLEKISKNRIDKEICKTSTRPK